MHLNLNWKKLCDIASTEVEATLMKLPAPLQEEAKQLPVTLERIPNARFLEEGIEADALGLFTGAEFAEKGYIPVPSQIILFVENHWNYAEGDENIFREEIRVYFFARVGTLFGVGRGRFGRARPGIARFHWHFLAKRDLKVAEKLFGHFFNRIGTFFKNIFLAGLVAGVRNGFFHWDFCGLLSLNFF